MASNAGPVAKSGAVRRFSGPVRSIANSETPICCLTPSHHGEAGAAGPSSAEAFLRAVDFKGIAL